MEEKEKVLYVLDARELHAAATRRQIEQQEFSVSVSLPVVRLLLEVATTGRV